MRAAVMRHNRLVVDEVPDPVPGPGQVLLETVACGICGSDLHALRHTQAFVETSRESENEMFVFDVGRDVVMGHEFSARVLEPGDSGLRAGDPVVALPVMPWLSGGMDTVGYSNDFPGGYGERLLVLGGACRVVPNGLELAVAALNEPTSVALHAVERSGIAPGQPAIVLGCGPVGLLTVAWLAARGVAPIVGSDFSPARRALALKMGAHAAVDPRESNVRETWQQLDSRHADPDRGLVVFEAVGVPGTIQEALRIAPRGARIVVVGVCMETDRFEPCFGINKELSIDFVLGWTPDEFDRTLRALAEGEVDPRPLVTGEVGIAGLPDAFEALADPETHAKILVRPELDA